MFYVFFSQMKHDTHKMERRAKTDNMKWASMQAFVGEDSEKKGEILAKASKVNSY